MDKKVTGIVAYFTLIGWLIAYLAGDKNGAKFHLNQALVLAIAEIVLGFVGGILGLIPIIGGLVSFVLSVLLFICWVLGLVGAIKGEEKPVPVVGGIKILK
ncbi:MAG: hypothetical protein IJY10_10495 [Lachnospiraceae bacterium]|nr:hypothetical protein [Lachnospiraceae bacterium]